MSPSEMEKQAREAGLTLKELLVRASISHTTFYRWRTGRTQPQMRLYRRISEVLREARAT